MISAEEFIKFMHGGSSQWKNQGFKSLEGKDFKLNSCNLAKVKLNMKEAFITDAEGLLALFENLNDRVKSLEEYTKELEEWTKELKDHLLKLHTMINLKPTEHPHKCPVCDGTRTCHSKDSGLSWQCESCEGKGIVWG